MTNNDVLRRIRFIFNFNDQKMMGIFALANLSVTREQVIYWLKKDDAPDFVKCKDIELASFLNGLIIEKRGKKDGELPEPEKRLNYNMILTKLRIALSLRAEDIVEMMRQTNLWVSKNELSAFFRQPDHKNYRECQAQFLRNFLLGAEKKFFVERPEKYISEKQPAESFEKQERPHKTSPYKAGPSKTRAGKTSPGKGRTDKFSAEKNSTEKNKTRYVNPNAGQPKYKSEKKQSATSRDLLKLKTKKSES